MDEKKNKLTVPDSGIGMTKDELISNIRAIAKSGTSATFHTNSKT